MKNLFLSSLISFFALSLLAACSTPKPEEKPQPTAEKAGVMDVEPVKERLNVYTSMARATKYNVTAANRNLYQKVVSDTFGKNSEQIFSSLKNVKNSENMSLLEATRNLDFSIVYAASHLTQNNKYVQSYIYQKTAQQLALATISAHQNALFALRKIKEIDRKISSQEKSVAALDAKLNRSGGLSESDLEYKKTLEVSIHKMQQLKSFLEAEVKDFASLIKVENKNLHLAGKNFYELQDFDQRNKLSTFQNTAFDYRSEFDLARKEVWGFNPRNARDKLDTLYPETKRLELNDINENTKLYLQNLILKANTIAQKLVENVVSYIKEQDVEQKNYFLKTSFENLSLAIMVQLELDFAMVKSSDDDFLAATAETARLKNEIRQLERRRNLNDDDKNLLINKRLQLDEQELKQTQISAERAAALRAMYFHAGLSPFSEVLLKEKIAPIEKALKKAFNQDMIDMLAKADVHEEQLKNSGNTWAKKDNWLEILIDQGGKKEDKPISLPLKPVGDFDPYEDASYDKMPIMQLGAYRKKENADIEWQMLKEIYPEFSAAKPKIESSMQDGKMMYRLILKSQNGGWLSLCNKLRSDKVECILRQK